MTRSRASAKKAGSAWETEICTFLTEGGIPAERRARKGALDTGDISGLGPMFACEAKDTHALTLASWIAEANVEALNAHADIGVAWAKRARKSSPGDAYVLLDGNAFLRLLLKLRAAGLT